MRKALGYLIGLVAMLGSGVALAQNATTGAQLYASQSCAACHGADPLMPTGLLFGGPGGMICGQNWPVNTSHALKTLCATPSPSQANARSVFDTSIMNVPLMAGYMALTPQQREDIAAFLLSRVPAQATAQFRRPTDTTALASLDFGGVNEGMSSVRVVHLLNTGTVPITLAASNPLAVGGTNAARYSLVALPGGETTPQCAASAVLAATTGRCAVAVSFNPDTLVAVGTQQTAVLTANSTTAAIGSLQLTGSRLSPTSPTLVLTPSGTTVNLPPTPAGMQSPAVNITVTNGGNGPLNITSLTVGGNNAAEFIRAGTCQHGQAVAAGLTCVITLNFAPPAGTTGSRTATLTIGSNAPGSPVTLTLIATVGTMAPTVAYGSSSNADSPLLLITATQVGAQTTGQVFIRNIGQLPLTVTSVQVSSGNPPFAVINTGTCIGTPVAVGGSCTVTVGFTPAAMTNSVGTLTVSSNASTLSGTPGPHVIQLEGRVSGSATPTTTLSMNRSSVDFRGQPVNTSSLPETIVIRNTGANMLTVASAVVNRGAQSDFTVTNNCAFGTVSGNTCDVRVTFRPRADGARTDTLTITYNGPGATPRETVSLSGIGQAQVANVSAGGGGSLSWPLVALLALALGWASQIRRRPS